MFLSKIRPFHDVGTHTVGGHWWVCVLANKRVEASEEGHFQPPPSATGHPPLSTDKPDGRDAFGGTGL